MVALKKKLLKLRQMHIYCTFVATRTQLFLQSHCQSPRRVTVPGAGAQLRSPAWDLLCLASTAKYGMLQLTQQLFNKPEEFGN